jgi:allantoate deiminase
MKQHFDIDSALVERYLRQLASFGAVGPTGVSRPVYSPPWAAAQDQIATWGNQAGLTVRRDEVGNVWCRLEGTDNGKAIVSGSHIDSQLPGGQYDGALGVVGALIALDALKRQFGAPKRPLEAVSFCEEEGSRFAGTHFWGSRAVAGRVGPNEAETLRDYDGISMADAMRSVGLNPKAVGHASRSDIGTYLELHVEQGPVLEQRGLPAGIVNRITGLRHYRVEVVGRDDHAGGAPMDLRRDPMACAAEMISRVIDTASTMGRPAVTTVGRVIVEPNYPAIVPKKVTFMVDARHPDPAAIVELFRRHAAAFDEVGGRRHLPVRWEAIMDHPPCPADPATVQVLEEAARAAEVPVMTMHSGAGHDAQMMANIANMAMIFVQSKDGRSHPDPRDRASHACLLRTTSKPGAHTCSKRLERSNTWSERARSWPAALTAISGSERNPTLFALQGAGAPRWKISMAVHTSITSSAWGRSS